MKCSNCGAEIESDERFCSQCGTRVQPVQPVQKHKVTINTVHQTALVTPVIEVYLNDQKVAWIGKGETAVVEVEPGQNEFLFKWAFRKCTVTLDGNEDKTISLKWNRLWGTLEALCR